MVVFRARREDLCGRFPFSFWMSQDSCSEKDEPGVRGGGTQNRGDRRGLGFSETPRALAT